MMNAKQTFTLTLFLLMVVIAAGAACSLTQIKAQSTNNRTERARQENVESSVPAYKPQKRISKDIIKTDEKPESSNKNKVKTR